MFIALARNAPEEVLPGAGSKLPPLFELQAEPRRQALFTNNFYNQGSLTTSSSRGGLDPQGKAPVMKPKGHLQTRVTQPDSVVLSLPRLAIEAQEIPVNGHRQW